MFVDVNGQPITEFDAIRADDPKKLVESMREPEIGVGEAFGAAFRQENIVGSFITNYNPDIDKSVVDPNWEDRWSELAGSKYERFSHKFLDVHNDAAWEALKTQIDIEEQDRITLQNAGWLGVATSLTAGLVDLPSLIPGGAIVRGAMGGIKVGKSALRAAAYGAGAATAAEGALYATQELRTPGESVVAIGATTLLSALLGGAVARQLTGAEQSALASKFMKQVDDAGKEIGVDDVDEAIRQVYSAGNLSAGAATLEQTGLANKMQQILGKLQRWSPGMRGATYEVPEGADLMANIVETPAMRMTNVKEGALSQPQAVETLMNISIDGTGNVRRRDVEQIFKEARAAGQGMPRREFIERVAYAMRRGDVDPAGNEFVARAARRNREVLDHFAKEAQALGLLPDDLTPQTATSYLSRVWNRDRVISHRPQLRAIIRKNIAKAARAMEARGKSSLVAGELEDYVDDVADEIIDQLAGGSFDISKIDYLRTTKNGPLKGRTLKVRDEDVEFFLMNDSEFIMDRYIRTMAGHVEFQRKFGTTNVDEILEDAKVGMERVRAEAEKLTGKAREKRLKKIEKDWNNFRKDVIAMRDRLFGTLHLDQRTSNMGTMVDAANTLAYVSFGGLFSIASLPEMATIILRDMVRPFTENGVGRLVKDVSALKLNKAELQDLGVAVELIRDHRMSLLTGTADVLDTGSPVRNFARETRRVFSRVNGLTYFTNMMKSVAGVSIQQRMLRLARQASSKGFDSLLGYQKQWMATLGVGREHAARLGKLFDKYGDVTESGALVPNTRAWDVNDEGIANSLRRYQAAVKKATDETVITPGAGDMPIFADTNLGRALSLFTSFTFASLSRLSMNATVSSNYGLIAGAVTMSGLGTLSYVIREKVKGKPISDNPGRLVAEGVERSGLLGMIGYGNNLWERHSGLPGLMAGAQALFPGHDQQPPASRFAGRRSFVGAMAGPAAGYIDNARASWLALLDDNEMTPGEKKRALRLVPGNNLFYLNRLLQGSIEE